MPLHCEWELSPASFFQKSTDSAFAHEPHHVSVGFCFRHMGRHFECALSNHVEICDQSSHDGNGGP